MALGHYVEGQGDHYICLRFTPNFDCSKYKYDELISDTDNVQTKLDKHTTDMDNLQTKLDEHKSDMDTYKVNLTNITVL